MDFFDLKLSDVGLRYVHYSQLIELWESRINSIADRFYASKDDKEKAERLKQQVETLRSDMTNLEDYAIEGYRDIRAKVDQLNDVKPEHIFGGRGTELEGWEPGRSISNEGIS